MTMPWVLGLIWVADEDGRMIVFLIGAVMACISLGLAFLIPRQPRAGFETMLNQKQTARTTV